MHLPATRYSRFGWIALLWFLSACSTEGGGGVLAPKGDGAIAIASLWWVMLAVAVVVYLLVLVFLWVALLRHRRLDLAPDLSPPPSSARLFLGISGIVMPVVVLTFLFGYTLTTLAALSPPEEDTPLTIEVVGHRWWWEVRYPQHGIITANEIHIPTGSQVELRLTSEDVIHSLWIPELRGKTDLIPGQSNHMTIYADQAGEYLSQCAEFCGLQHTFMRLYVVASAPDDFNQWVTAQQQPAPTPEDELVLEGQQVFLGSSCVYCHTIAGTSASGVIGPNLTHFASRRTIGAGALPNTPGHLAGWLIDSQASKPGNRMPPMYLAADELHALLVYMETLR